MFIRFDVGHPKQAWQTAHIIKHLKDIDFVVTARGALGTDVVAKALGLKPLILGGYSGDLYRKLVDDLLRAKRLADLVQVLPRDAVLITFGMPSGVRVAFGLKIPIIHINDTPHNEPVRRLTAPLSDYVITPLPEVKNRRDTIPRRTIMPLYGVPEMSYVPEAEDLMGGEPLEEAKNLLEEVGEFVFFRYAERKASYGLGSINDFHETFETIYNLARENDLNVVLYSRYPDERINRPGVYRIERTINMPFFIRHAKLVISSGGSIAKEASLQGVPVVVTHYRLDSTERLRRHGFPLIDGRRNLIDAFEKALNQKQSTVPDLENYDKLYKVVLRCLELL